jgi:hypothetical protein
MNLNNRMNLARPEMIEHLRALLKAVPWID